MSMHQYLIIHQSEKFDCAARSIQFHMQTPNRCLLFALASAMKWLLLQRLDVESPIHNLILLEKKDLGLANKLDKITVVLNSGCHRNASGT
jgi:hypothetical protein